MQSNNIFIDDKNLKSNQVESVLLTLADFNRDTNKVLKVDSKEEVLKDDKYIFPAEDIVNIASVLSLEEEKNIFILNESFDNNLKSLSFSLENNFLKIYNALVYFQDKYLKAGISISILNMLTPSISSNNLGESLFLIPNHEIRNDIALMRNLGNVNIFLPADTNEAEYLLKINEKGFFKNQKNNLSYFRLNYSHSPEIFSKDFFDKDGNLKEWSPLPDIVYISKNIDSAFSVSIIACGPVLYNAILAAKELEARNFKVTVLNMSLVSSNNEYINEKIKIFIQNFAENNKNILTVEEHSKVGGLGSLISEIVSERGKSLNARVERLGLEDNLSSQNIISKAEEISGF